MKKILFLISHPAHFHMFKLTIENLKSMGFKVLVVIRPKDVLEELCINSQLDFVKIKSRPTRFGMFGLAFALIDKELQLFKITSKFKPDLLVGSDGVLAHVGFFNGIPSFECSEDDAEAVKLYAILSFPFYTNIICPNVCSAWLWSKKKIGYESYHELGYLHPNQFTPDINVVKKYFNPDEKYFLIRFANLNAHHDVGIKGINTIIARRLIEILSPHGTIYITSERKLEPEFENFRISINPQDMHHLMAFAEIYIGDSQTMAAEAGVLGVPFVRFNDFVGRLSYLAELENKFQLGFGHRTSDIDGLYHSVELLVQMHNKKELFLERKEAMILKKIDYAKFLTWFLANYPQSKEIMKGNPDYQFRFK